MGKNPNAISRGFMARLFHFAPAGTLIFLYIINLFTGGANGANGVAGVSSVVGGPAGGAAGIGGRGGRGVLGRGPAPGHGIPAAIPGANGGNAPLGPPLVLL